MVRSPQGSLAILAPVLRCAITVKVELVKLSAGRDMSYSAAPWPGAGEVEKRAANCVASVTAVPALF